jgi:hypothetical protein
MLQWKPRLVLVLAAATVLASQLGGLGGILVKLASHSW